MYSAGKPAEKCRLTRVTLLYYESIGRPTQILLFREMGKNFWNIFTSNHEFSLDNLKVSYKI
jgi:hypothetical protein